MDVLDVFSRARGTFWEGVTMSRTLWLVAFVLVVIGALNWGLVGLAQFDLVAALFGGSAAILSRIVYGLVGIAGLLLAVLQMAPRPRSIGVRPAVDRSA
jgi:uncharacterized membrane protein YuzA (DUF378 family)